MPGLSAPAARPKSVNLIWPVVSIKKFCRGKSDITPRIVNTRAVTIIRRVRTEAHLGFEIAVDVAEFVQLGDGAKHLGDVEPRVLFLQDARVVEQGPEIAAGDEILSRAQWRSETVLVRRVHLFTSKEE